MIRGAAPAASADQLEQHRDLGLALGDVADVIKDQQIKAREMMDGGLEGDSSRRAICSFRSRSGIAPQQEGASATAAPTRGGLPIRRTLLPMGLVHTLLIRIEVRQILIRKDRSPNELITQAGLAVCANGG